MGLGGRSPPRNHLFHPVVCGVAARTMERQSTIRNLNSKMVNDAHMPAAWANMAMRCPFNGACPRVCVVSVGVAHRCGGNYTEFSAPGKPPDQAVLPARASLPGAALPASPQPSIRLRRTLTGGKEVVPGGRGSPTPSTRAGVWANGRQDPGEPDHTLHAGRGVGQPGFPIPCLRGPMFTVDGHAHGAPRRDAHDLGARAGRPRHGAAGKVTAPLPSPPPAGGRSRVSAPSGGGSGKGRSPCPRSRDAGGTPALPGHVHRGVVRHAHDRLT